MLDTTGFVNSQLPTTSVTTISPTATNRILALYVSSESLVILLDKVLNLWVLRLGFEVFTLNAQDTLSNEQY